MVNITVTGGSGFIGTRLVKRLTIKEELNVRIFDKKQSKLFPLLTTLGNVTSANQLRDSILDQSVIVHLAAEHRDDVRPLSLYREVNVVGAENLCSVAIDKSVKKIIFTSTVAVYGFADINTNERGKISPFNLYGQTKFEAEEIFRSWQMGSPMDRTLVIIRPTVVFGEQNRGNVYNLFRQIASGKFIMIGRGDNRKSIAYVENIAAFIEYSMSFNPGIHIFNYIDKPDYRMDQLVSHVDRVLGRGPRVKIKIPYLLGLFIGNFFDLLAYIFQTKFNISAIRVKKFCANSVYASSIESTDFVPPVGLEDAIKKTIQHEFIDDNKSEEVFFTE